MSRTNSLFGRGAPWRQPSDQRAQQPAQPGHNEDWGAADNGYDDRGASHQQGYYFPQAEDPRYAAHQDPYAQQQHNGYAPAPAHPAPGPSLSNYTAPQRATFASELRRGAQPQAPAPAWNGHANGHTHADPRGYDLGSYMPATEPAFPQHDPHAVDQYGQYVDARAGGYGHAELHNDYGHGEEPYEEYEEEPRRGRRGLMIVAALVGAIGVGSGLAYGYKMLGGGSGANAPVIKADAGPSKVKPSDPGGRAFAHTDKKLLNRLNDDGAPEQDEPGGPRRVRTVAIAPGGSGPAPANGMVTVPGVTLENIYGRSSSSPPEAPAGQMRPVNPPARVVAPAPEPPQAAPVPPPRQPVVVATVTPKVPVPKTKEHAAPVVATAATGIATAPPRASSGYVAVLSSQKSRMDALKAFADLQQKYSTVLAGKPADVQEANLGEKGVWYRAIVGPPASRDAASGLCGQLKAAGFGGCWVVAY
ncbi:MAG: SPOR domain-containing protein [Hyphomicrobiaceae bacterium]